MDFFPRMADALSSETVRFHLFPFRATEGRLAANKSVLAQIREKAGFASIIEASGAIGYHPVYLRQLENGQARISGSALVKLAKGYGLTVEALARRLAKAAA